MRGTVPVVYSSILKVGLLQRHVLKGATVKALYIQYRKYIYIYYIYYQQYTRRVR
jgi:hypothetical protein